MTTGTRTILSNRAAVARALQEQHTQPLYPVPEGEFTFFGSEVFNLVLGMTKAHMMEAGGGPGGRPVEIPPGYDATREANYLRWARRECNRLGLPWERPSGDKLPDMTDPSTILPNRSGGSQSVNSTNIGGFNADKWNVVGSNAAFLDTMLSMTTVDTIIDRYAVNPNNMNLNELLSLVKGSPVGIPTYQPNLMEQSISKKAEIQKKPSTETLV